MPPEGLLGFDCFGSVPSAANAFGVRRLAPAFVHQGPPCRPQQGGVLLVFSSM
jgi:hypothetical protein